MKRNLFAVWKGETAAEHFKLRIRRLCIISKVIQLRHGATETDCMQMWGVQRLRTNKTPVAFPQTFRRIDVHCSYDLQCQIRGKFECINTYRSYGHKGSEGIWRVKRGWLAEI
jgi:hypothetical protein